MIRQIAIQLCFVVAAACCAKQQSLQVSEGNQGVFEVKGGNVYRVLCTEDTYLSFDGKPATKDSVKLEKNHSQLFSIVKDQKIFAASELPANCEFKREK